MFLFRNKEINKLKKELDVLRKEKQILLDKYEKNGLTRLKEGEPLYVVD